jgi:hypothetical protein
MAFEIDLPGDEGAAVMEALTRVFRETVCRGVMQEFAGTAGILPCGRQDLAINKIITVRTESGAAPEVVAWEDGPAS